MVPLVPGVFAPSRNPIYIGMLMVLIGVATLLGTLTPLLVAVVFAWRIACLVIRPEEARLRQAFGEAYDQYARCVRRWV